MNATRTTKTKVAGAVSVVLGLFAMLALFLPASAHGAPGEHKVTLCHATASRTNPYVEITVDYHSIIKAGHGDHTGPVFDPSLPKDVAWGDIIPPFQLGGEDYAGLNWTAAGQAILAGGCAAGEPPATTVPPTTVPPTTVPPTTTTPPTTMPAEHKVTLCHATASRTNPYVEITVDYHSIINAGHGDHTGPVFDPSLPKGMAWGDIIPAFDFGGDAVFAGLNWTAAGQAIFAADCVVPEVAPVTTVPPTTAPPTTEAPTTTTTSAGDLVDVDVDVDGEGSSVSTEVETRVLGASESPAPAPAAPEGAQVLGAQQTRPTTATGSLPITGVDSGLLLAVALMLVTGGLVLVRQSRQSQV